MSDEGRNYVKQNSPFTGTTFWFHYIIGDMVNAQHNYTFWMGDKRVTEEWPISVRAVQRARAELIEGGYLEVIGSVGRDGAVIGGGSTAPGQTLAYRFIFLGVETPANQATVRRNTRQSGGERPPKSEVTPITNESELNTITTDPAGSVDAAAATKSKKAKPEPTAEQLEQIESIFKAYPPNAGNPYAGKALIRKLLLRGESYDHILFAASTKARESREQNTPRQFTTSIQKFFSNFGDWKGYAEGYEAEATPPIPVGPPTGDLLQRAEIYDHFHLHGYWVNQNLPVYSHPGTTCPPPLNANGNLVDAEGREYTVDHQERRHYLQNPMIGAQDHALAPRTA